MLHLINYYCIHKYIDYKQQQINAGMTQRKKTKGSVIP